MLCDAGPEPASFEFVLRPVVSHGPASAVPALKNNDTAAGEKESLDVHLRLFVCLGSRYETESNRRAGCKFQEAGFESSFLFSFASRLKLLFENAGVGVPKALRSAISGGRVHSVAVRRCIGSGAGLRGAQIISCRAVIEGV